MSTSVTSVTKHFPSAQNGFTTTLASSISSGAATVPLNSVAGYTNGETVVLVIDPSSSTAKQTFTGVIDTAGVQVTGVVWTAGTNQTHAGGATVVDYATATHISMVTKGLLRDHNQSGYHKSLHDDNAATWIGQTVTASAVNYVDVANAATGSGPTIAAKGTDSNIDLNLVAKGTGQVRQSGRVDAWVTGVTAPTTVTALGNGSYSLVVNSTDLTGFLSAGMRLRTTRTVAAPTQCTSLNGTTQYYSKSSPAGMTFTNNFVVSAWVKLASYNGAVQVIASRYNGTSGWRLMVNTDGTIHMDGFNAGSANFSSIISYQSIPLSKWVHVVAQLDMSTFTATTTTSYIMINGVDVPASVSRGGTNPTALVQAGNLEIGSQNGGLLPFNGKIAQAAVYSAKVTQATILTSIHQTLAGTETSLISAYSFNNSISDLNANANNLTAQGSAVATNADSPFGGQADGTISSTLDYGIITKTAFSTNTTLTVQVPEGCTIPTSGGVSAMSYSTQKVPYLFPAQRGKWRVEYLHKVDASQSAATSATWYNVGSVQFTIPVGEWMHGFQLNIQASDGTNGPRQYTTLSTTSSTETDALMTSVVGISSSNTTIFGTVSKEKDLSLSTATVYYLNHRANNAVNTTVLQLNGSATGGSRVYAELAHL